MKLENVCYNCFQEREEGAVGGCPHCGYDPQDKEKYPLALPHGTVLNGRYITGRVLGQGGFGVTYVASDWKTKQRVAIKEYLPDTMATRTDGRSVSAYSGERGDSFAYGKECFLKEAQTLAEFIGNPNIVRVHSYFEEYGTAYFVMDYVEGTSFQEYIKEHGGKIPWQEAEKILLPIMEALGAVHGKGIVHRDVTPDNIFITEDGTVKLLDFGAARYSLGDKSRSLDVVLKHGFAPKEQYTRHGRQGAYTDVYTVSASFYYAVTGRRPPDSIDRLEEDDLVPPRSLGIDIPVEIEDAILKGLGVQPADRYQNMGEFKQALLPNQKKEPAEVPLPQTGGNVPQTGGNVPQTGGNVPQTGGNLPQTGRSLPQTGGNLPQTGRNLPQTGGNPEAAGNKKKLGIILGCAAGGVAFVVLAVSLIWAFIGNDSEKNYGGGYSNNQTVEVGNNPGMSKNNFSEETDAPEPTDTPEPTITPAPDVVYTYACNASLESIELKGYKSQGASIDSVKASHTFNVGDYIYCNFSCSEPEIIKSITWRLYENNGTLLDDKTDTSSTCYSSWRNSYSTYLLDLSAGGYYFEVSPEDVNGKTLDSLRWEFTLKEKKTSSAGTSKSGAYILPDSDKKYYSAASIKKLSAHKLRLARNEIYARHGYIFKDEGLKKYFEAKSWYKPKKKDVPDSAFNEYEKANIKLIKKYENKKQ